MKTISFVAAVYVAVLGVTADAQPITFNDPTVTTSDQFGHSVALDGNIVLIGAHRDDTLGDTVGQAHLFDALTGNLLRTFNDPTPTVDGDFGDRFGYSVALDGNNVLIGANSDHTLGLYTGQAYLFDALTSNLLWTFNDPTVTNGARFGWSVALDGNKVLIGAIGDDTLDIQAGQAHLFDALTGNLLRTFNDPTPTVDGNFGFSVALDGNNVLIAAIGAFNGTDVGQAHLFDAVTGNLLQTFNDPTPITSDQFGWSVALDSNHVLIGATGDDTLGQNVGQAHLFDALTGNLLRTFNDPTVTGGDRFGSSVALDGNNVLIGASGDGTNGTEAGQAHLFDATTGNLLQTFNDPTPDTVGPFGDQFGNSVALDGTNVLIGARNDDTLGDNIGQAHLFTPSPGDFDFNGDVDGFDFLKWQRGESPDPFSAGDLAAWEANYGTAQVQPGDFDGNGIVDGHDFLKWQQDPTIGSLSDWETNYGMGATLSATSASVPEPTTCTLALAALCLAMSRRRV